tara:strand:+ start:113 stop:238 length:126 start_codon:yes stop_codon:yes gene_type:complete
MKLRERMKWKEKISTWSLYWRFEIVLVLTSFVVGFVLGLFI